MTTEPTYKTVQICIAEGQICKSEGNLHDQSFFISTVFRVMAAARIEPIKYEELKSEVITARSLGWLSSPIKAEPEMIANRMPTPKIMRETMYKPTLV